MKKVGLVFGGGGARCFAHLGILQVLQEEGIPIDYILGCSMGSLIGALAANGVPIDTIKREFYRLPTRLKWFIPSGFSTLSQKAVRDILRSLLTVADVEALPIRSAFLATNLTTGERLIIDAGNIVDAVCASCAHPVINKPLKRGDVYLSDGGILDCVPADVCREVMGTDNLVVTCSLETTLNQDFQHVNKINSLFRSIYIPMLQARQSIIHEHSDVIFEPMKDIPFDFSHWRHILNFDSIDLLEDAFERGRSEARAKLPELQAMLV